MRRIKFYWEFLFVATAMLGISMLMVPTVRATTISFQQEFHAGSIGEAEDTYIYKLAPISGTCQYDYLYIGRNPDAKSVGLLRFDISHLNGRFSAITGARLKMVVQKNLLTAARPFDLYQVQTNNNRFWSGEFAITGYPCWEYRAYDVSTPLNSLVWDGGAGLLTPNVSYKIPAISSISVGPSNVPGTWLTWNFSNPAFLLNWISNPLSNGGLLLKNDTITNTEYVTFSSCDAVLKSVRPILEIDVTGYVPPSSSSITYALTEASKVSIVIKNASGQIVRELLHAVSRSAGVNVEKWDGRDEANNLLPAGNYSWQLLSSQGLTTTYAFTLGVSLGQPTLGMDEWPGNHLPPTAVAVDANNKIYCLAGVAEGPPAIIAMDENGNRLWTSSGRWFIGEEFNGVRNIDMCVDNGKMYVLVENGSVVTLDMTAGDVDLSDPDNSYSIMHESETGNQRDIMDIDVRNGVLVASYKNQNVVRWFDAATGVMTRQASITGPQGIALESNGDLLVVKSGYVYRFQGASNTPVCVVSSNTMQTTDTFRIAVDPRNGDFLVTAKGSDQRIRRFAYNGRTPSGAYGFLAIYGVAGGRTFNGAYDKNGYADISSIAVAPDGSFWVAEPDLPPYRVLHCTVNGAWQKEFTCIGQYVPWADVDPVDPRWVYLEIPKNARWERNRAFVIRFDVNYDNGNWTINSINEYTHPLLGKRQDENYKFQVRKHRGYTYLCKDGLPNMYCFDEATKKLYPVCLTAVARKDGTWQIPTEFQPSGTQPANLMYSWADLNNDGLATLNEIRFTPGTFTEQGGTACNSHISTSLQYTGVFSWSSAFRYGGPDLLEPVSFTGRSPIYDWATLQTGITENIPSTILDISKNGYCKDLSGSIYTTASDTYRSVEMYPGGVLPWGRRVTANNIIKWNSSGNIQWIIGRHSKRAGVEPGEMIYPWRMDGDIGDYFMVGDMELMLEHVYHKDGLYVGRLLEQHPADPSNTLYNWEEIAGENFGGNIYCETNGEVHFLAGAANKVMVYNITGWENIKFQNGTVTWSP